MTDDDFYKLVDKIYKISFPNGDVDFDKSLWRMSKGCREEAFYILQSVVAAYNIQLTDDLFDHAVAKANGGCEIEWLTEYLEVPIEDYPLYMYNKKCEKCKAINNYFAGDHTITLIDIINS